MTVTFKTLNDNADPTFNQDFGINNSGKITGYFGSAVPATVINNKGEIAAFVQNGANTEGFPRATRRSTIRTPAA